MAGAGEWDLALRRRNLKIAVPLLVVLTVVLVAVFADALAPFDPTAQHLTYRLRPPRWADRGDPRFLLGTDQLGRDVHSLLIYGASVSNTIALAGTTTFTIIG